MNCWLDSFGSLWIILNTKCTALPPPGMAQWNAQLCSAQLGSARLGWNRFPRFQIFNAVYAPSHDLARIPVRRKCIPLTRDGQTRGFPIQLLCFCFKLMVKVYSSWLTIRVSFSTFQSNELILCFKSWIDRDSCPVRFHLSFARSELLLLSRGKLADFCGCYRLNLPYSLESTCTCLPRTKFLQISIGILCSSNGGSGYTLLKIF